MLLQSYSKVKHTEDVATKGKPWAKYVHGLMSFMLNDVVNNLT